MPPDEKDPKDQTQALVVATPSAVTAAESPNVVASTDTRLYEEKRAVMDTTPEYSRMETEKARFQFTRPAEEETRRELMRSKNTRLGIAAILIVGVGMVVFEKVATALGGIALALALLVVGQHIPGAIGAMLSAMLKKKAE